MEVRKRSGDFEPVNLDKIIKSIERVCTDLNGSVDVYSIGVKTIAGVYNGVSTKELDELSIQSAVGMISTDPIYSKVAARLLSNYIHKEVENQEIFSFSQSIEVGFDSDLISEKTYKFVKENKRKLNNLVDRDKDKLFEYYGLRIVYDRYLLKHPEKRTVIETPQYWLLRVACGLAETAKEAVEFYNLISTLDYIPATPTLFNSGTTHSQMSSCYLLDSPEDNLTDIYKRYSDIAQLSKWAGGIGLSYSKVRGNGGRIKGTNGKSNGIRPWIHTLSASVGAVNQCFVPETIVKGPENKPIKEIEIGDNVTNTFGIDTVKNTMNQNYSGELITIKVNEKTYRMTPEHPILVVKNGNDYTDEVLRFKLKNNHIRPEWIEAQLVNNNDVILSVEGRA